MHLSLIVISGTYDEVKERRKKFRKYFMTLNIQKIATTLNMREIEPSSKLLIENT